MSTTKDLCSQLDVILSCQKDENISCRARRMNLENGRNRSEHVICCGNGRMHNLDRKCAPWDMNRGCRETPVR